MPRKPHHLYQTKKGREVLRMQTMDMLVLALLSGCTMCAPELLDRMAELTDNALAYARLQTPLSRLERQAFICRAETPPGRPAARVYFSITPEGRRYLEYLTAEYRRFNRAVEVVLGQIPEQTLPALQPKP
ncbi:MAG TPA: PadR family transcriptional regulator [Candidatus Gemmiger faecigallinarum]|nr:PadR family transcriptional regulator [Candidatus Gemmiger faecigallinarum]